MPSRTGRGAMQGECDDGWSWVRSTEDPAVWDIYDDAGIRRGVYHEVGWAVELVENGEVTTKLLEMCRPTPEMRKKINVDVIFVSDPRRAASALREYIR